MSRLHASTLQTSIRVAALCAGICTFGAGLRSAAAASAPDSWITVKAKIALATGDNVKASAIHVDTIDGKVTLYGKVPSDAQRKNAGSIVKHVSGVSDVRNLLQVVRESREKAVDANDDRIKADVQRLLRDDNNLSDSITVKSVNKGQVLLAGSARDLSDYLRSLESAWSVNGVRSVASEVTSTDDLPAFDDWHAPGATRNAARDTWITMATKMRLLGDDKVPALDVKVDTYQGMVTLFGVVPSAAAKSAAEADANKVDSVTGVNNELQVIPRSQQEDATADDSAVKRAVLTAFKDHPEFKDIDVDVRNRVAHLGGKVASGWQRLHAAVIARAAHGVRSVDDDLHIEVPRG